MIIKKGQQTGLDISPLAGKIQINTQIVNGVASSSLNYRNCTNYLVQNGVRTAPIQDSIKGVAGTYVLGISDMEPADAQELDRILVKYYEKKVNEDIAAQEAKDSAEIPSE